MKKTFYTLLFLITASHLSAQKWDGSSSTNWNTAANWDNNTVPAAGSAVTIDVTAPNQPKLAGNVTIKELKISAGTLNLNGFTLTTTDKVEFIGGTVQNGAITIGNNIPKMENTTFTGPLTLTLSGANGNNKVNGNNTFNGAVTIINNSGKDLTLADQSADIFNGDMTFVQSATGNFFPASTGVNNFKGNISTTGSAKQVVFGQNGGTVAIIGNKTQNVNGAVAQLPKFNKLVMNTTGDLMLNVPAVIGTSLTLTNGVIFTTATNLLTINDNATSAGGSNTTYIYGPVKKSGNDAFTFPTGKAGLFAPISISAPSAASDLTAEYFNTPTPHSLTLLDLFVNHISKEEYWSLNRNTGTGTVVVTLSFNAAERSGGISNLSALKISRWNSLLNLSSDLGNGGTTGNLASGTVKTASATGSFGDFTLASSSTANPMTLSTTPKTLGFTNPSTTDNVVWTFSDVTTGVDAIITMTGSKNASISEIDNSSSYNNSWQPFIKYTNTTTKSSDSSYVEFNVKFVRNGMLEAQKAVAMTVIDQDGEGKAGGFREMLKVSQPAVSKGIVNSLVTVTTDPNWLTLLGTTQLFENIDTTAYTAMSQVNFSNVSSYTMRVGVLGKISGGTVRQASFAFQNFQSMNVVLPVKLLNFDAQYAGKDAKLTWATTEEENLNRFDVYRSIDGVNYTLVGTVKANGNMQAVSNYSLVDNQLPANFNSNIFYKLHMIDNNEHATWSSVALLSQQNSKLPTSVSNSVYPNPTKGELNLSFENLDSEVSIEVVDLFGKVLQSYSNADLDYRSSLALDVTNFDNGIYFIRVVGQDGNATLTRFIKN